MAQQNTEDGNRRRGIDPDRPQKHADLCFDSSDLGFYSGDPSFNSCESCFKSRKSRFKSRYPSFYARNLTLDNAGRSLNRSNLPINVGDTAFELHVDVGDAVFQPSKPSLERGQLFGRRLRLVLVNPGRLERGVRLGQHQRHS